MAGVTEHKLNSLVEATVITFESKTDLVKSTLDLIARTREADRKEHDELKEMFRLSMINNDKLNTRVTTLEENYVELSTQVTILKEQVGTVLECNEMNSRVNRYSS